MLGHLVNAKPILCIIVYEDAIWNNQKSALKKLSIFQKGLFAKGIITFGDLLSDAAIFLKGVKVLNANLSPI